MAIYSTLSAFKAGPISNKVQVLQDPSVAFGTFNWETANAPYTADDVNVIKADSTALSVGAWVRQSASSVAFQAAPTGAITRSASDQLNDLPLSAAGFATLQAAMDAVASKGGDLIFPPGTYALSQPLTLTMGSKPVCITGYGVTLQTTGAFEALKIVGNGRNPSRIAGFTIDQGGNATATAGISLFQTAHLHLEDILVKAPSATVNSGYAGVLMGQTSPTDPGSGNFWTDFRNVSVTCSATDAAAVGVKLLGAQNETDLSGIEINNVRQCVLVDYYPGDPSGYIANTVRLDGAAFEQFVTAVAVNAKSGAYSIEGLSIVDARFEPSTVAGYVGTQQILSLQGTTLSAIRPPEIIRPKMIGAMNFMSNPQGLDVVIVDHSEGTPSQSILYFSKGLKLKSKNAADDVLIIETQNLGSGASFTDNAGNILATLRWAASGVFDIVANAAQNMALRFGRVRSISLGTQLGNNLAGEVTLDASGTATVAFGAPEPTNDYIILLGQRGSIPPTTGVAAGVPRTNGFDLHGPANTVVGWMIVRTA